MIYSCYICTVYVNLLLPCCSVGSIIYCILLYDAAIIFLYILYNDKEIYPSILRAN